MAFFSLTGWAEDISTANVAVGDYTYGNDAALGIKVVWKGETLTSGTEYTWDTHFYGDAACTEDKGTDKTKLEVGTYYVKVTGVGTGGFSGTATGSFNVTKAPLEVTVTMDPAAPTKVYDGTTANPEGVTITSWAGKAADYKNGDTDLGGAKPVNVTGTLTWSYANANVGDQPITFTGLTFKNYEPTYTAKTIKITPKTLTAAMVTTANFEKTYKGKAFDPDKDLAVTVKDGTTPLVAGTDFNVKVYEEVGMLTEVAAPKNVGTYYVGVKGIATTNYTGGPIAVGTFKINKANLTVLVNDQSFVYDGTNTIADKIDKTYGADKGYQFVGLVGDDTQAAITGTRVIGVADDTKKVAGEYAITATQATFTQANENYTLFFQPGTFTIEKRNLTIKADDEAIPLGGAPSLTYTLTGSIATEEADMESAAEGKGNIKVTRKAGDTDDLGVHTGVLEVSYNAEADIFKNYNVTATNGNLTIGGGTILVTVKPQTIAYGDAETWATPQKGRDYFLNGVAEADEAKLNIVITREDAENKEPGTYALTVTATKPEGYTAINFVNSTLTIGKRELQVTALDQTLAVGQAVDGLDLSKIEFAEGHGLAFEDKAADILKLKFSATVEGGLDGEGKLTLAQVGDKPNGIEVALKNATDPHYTLVGTAGDLTVTDALVLNRPNKAAYEADPTSDDAASVIAGANGKTVDVTFGDFAMLKEKWYPIVLPFATSVKEVSEKFGYAIVNILKADNDDKTKIRFKLHMGNIAANEPFVVKIYEDKNMNTVIFGGKTIVNSAAPEVADASGVKFIGSYSAKTDGFKANEAFFSVSATKNDYYWGPSSTYLAPLAAYFQIPANEAAARTIEFEEADGTTTAIQVVKANNAKAGNAEGWYTVGGMKLQGAPTQKGVYIQNGKKVIIK